MIYLSISISGDFFILLQPHSNKINIFTSITDNTNCCMLIALKYLEATNHLVISSYVALKR